MIVLSIDTAITVNIISTSLIIFAYAYLYKQYKYKYLVKWIVAWGLYLIRQIFMDTLFTGHTTTPLFDIVYATLSIGYSLLIIAGTAEFSGKRLSRIWPVSAFICLLIIGLVRIHTFSFEYYAIPGVLFIGTAYIGAGLLIRKFEVPGMGRTITASAFIILGIHFYDMLILFSVPWVVPWGYFIDGICKLFVGLGTLLIYFEKTKHELENYYRLLAENTIDVIYRYRLDCGVFEYISPAVKKLSGYEASRFTNIKDIMRIMYPDDRKKFTDIIRKSVIEGYYPPMRIVRQNGEIIWIEPKIALLYDRQGSAAAAEGIIRDVTNRVLLEQDVARLDRLNIAGQMAASLAHEVRNPLSTVRGYIQLMSKRKEFSHYLDRLDLMLGEIDRTNSIITEYLLLSKNKVAKTKKNNLNAIIDTLYPLIKVDATASGVAVELHLGDIPYLSLDDNEIKQLLLNLVRNGIEAMTYGGRLLISTSCVNDKTVLSICDEGKGIPPQVLDNLGKPFLTTKDNGTGLGMAVCFRIVSRHNAKLEFDTGPNGTTAYVEFDN